MFSPGDSIGYFYYDSTWKLWLRQVKDIPKEI